MATLVIEYVRIGNLVSHFGKTITAIEGVCVWEDWIQNSNYSERGIEEFEYIPINEEWIHYFGFVKDVVSGDWVIKTPTYPDFVLDKNFQPIKQGVHIADYTVEYVHQLQNIAFLATGLELYNSFLNLFWNDLKPIGDNG